MDPEETQTQAASMDPARVEGFLKGLIPVGDKDFADAYGDGLRKFSSQEKHSVFEEFKPAELGSMLLAGGDIRSLGLHVFHNLVVSASMATRSIDSLYSILKEGIIPIICVCAHDISIGLLDESEHHTTEMVAQISIIAETLSILCSEKLLPDKKIHGMTSSKQFGWLARAIQNVLVDAVNERVRGMAVAPRELEIFTKLFNSWKWLLSHAPNRSELMESSYCSDMISPDLLKASFQVFDWFPRSEHSLTVAMMIKVGTNFRPFNELLSREGGCKKVVDIISSTMQNEETTEVLLVAVSNLLSTEEFAADLIEARALTYLQPAVLHTNAKVKLQACFAIACLASRDDITDQVLQSGVLALLVDVLRQITPGCENMDSRTWEPSDVSIICKLLNGDTMWQLKLAALHVLAATLQETENIWFIKTYSQIIQLLRTCAANSDPFVYQATIFILFKLELAIPSFRPVADVSSISGKVCDWSIDTVCEWVSGQTFKCYTHHFRENFVNGRVLLSLKDKDLHEMGISRAMHRRAIVFAIEDLAASGQEEVVSLPGISRGIGASLASTYDVFISYRRVGGSDFAHLIKLSLKDKGLNCFLDIDNLGGGSFDDSLMASLAGSKNVLLIWSKGCWDRFLEPDADIHKDFVAMEYMQAMKLKKNIVPVYKEDFEFVPKERLPPALQPIMNYNAVKFVNEYREASLDSITKLMVG